MSILGNRRVAVCRELTKLHEEVFRGTVQEAAAHFTDPRGEFTLVIAGYQPPGGVTDIADVTDRIAGLKRAGKSAREAVAQLAEETGQSKKELYRLWVGQS
jgi:16S rRNA (cytidine1402-2'-O)-methyltransferase